MDIFTQNMAESLLILGLALLVLEVLVLGFSTFFLFFLGLGCIATGVVFFLDLIEPNMTNTLISIALVTGVSSLLLWPSLKRMQDKVDTKAVTNDLIGHRFRLKEDLSNTVVINHQYSGINWKVSCDSALEKGTEVEVIEVGVGKMKVQPIG